MKKQRLCKGGKTRRRMQDGGMLTKELPRLAVEEVSDILGAIAERDVKQNINENPAVAMKKEANKNVAVDIAGKTAKLGATGFTIAGPIGAAIGAGAGALLGTGKAIIGHKDRLQAREDASEEFGSNRLSAYMSSKARSSYRKGGKVKETIASDVTKGHGGTIEGTGGPKDDAIDRNVPEGSFVVPAENADKAMEYGKELFGWKENEKAVVSRKNGEPVSLSNGEVLFTPEEVNILTYHGVDLNDLAPNAKEGTNEKKDGGLSRKEDYGSKKKPYPKVKGKNFAGGHRSYPIPTRADAVDALRLAGLHGRSDVKAKVYRKYPGLRKKMADGGGVWNEKYENFRKEYLLGNPKANEAEIRFGFGTFQLKNEDERRSFAKEYPYKTGLIPVGDNGEIMSNVNTSRHPSRIGSKTKSFLKESDLGLAEIAGAGQALMGASRLLQKGKPRLSVANELSQLSRETQEEATYGLEAGVKSSFMRGLASARRDLTNKVVMAGGGDANVSQRMRQIMAEQVRGEQDLILADTQERNRKKEIARSIKASIADRKNQIQDRNLEDWYKEQDAFADLLSSGISNIVGARQYRKELEFYEKQGTARPKITINK